jgi:hypothetical protein
VVKTVLEAKMKNDGETVEKTTMKRPWYNSKRKTWGFSKERKKEKEEKTVSTYS